MSISWQEEEHDENLPFLPRSQVFGRIDEQTRLYLGDSDAVVGEQAASMLRCQRNRQDC